MIDNEFVQQYDNLVMYVIRKKWWWISDDDMDDIKQETYIQLMEMFDRYNIEDRPINHWIYLAARRVMWERNQKGDVMKDSSDLDFSNDYSEAMLLTGEDQLTETNSYYYCNNKEEIDGLLNLLPDEQRDILILRLIFGYSHREMGEHFGVSEQRSRTALKRAKKNFEKLVNSEEPEKEVLQKFNVLKPYGRKTYGGDWAWRPNETDDRSPGEVKHYTQAEIEAYCKERSLKCH